MKAFVLISNALWVCICRITLRLSEINSAYTLEDVFLSCQDNLMHVKCEQTKALLYTKERPSTACDIGSNRMYVWVYFALQWRMGCTALAISPAGYIL